MTATVLRVLEVLAAIAGVVGLLIAAARVDARLQLRRKRRTAARFWRGQ